MSNPDTTRTDYIVQLDNHGQCEPDDIAPLDLREDATFTGSEYQYITATVEDQGKRYSIQILWLPDVDRAGICTGGDSVWTDATSPEDAIRRFIEDDLSN